MGVPEYCQSINRLFLIILIYYCYYYYTPVISISLVQYFHHITLTYILTLFYSFVFIRTILFPDVWSGGRSSGNIYSLLKKIADRMENIESKVDKVEKKVSYNIEQSNVANGNIAKITERLHSGC
jgi:hypothetical protein